MVRPHAVFIIGILLLIFAIGGWFAFTQRAVSRDTTTVLIEIAPGQSVRTIAQKLKDAKIIRNTQIFSFYVALHGVSGKLQAGTYKLSPSMNLPTIVQGIAFGKAVSNEIIIQVLEGWNSEQMGAYFEQKGLFSSADWNAAVATTDIHSLLPNASFSILSDKPATANLEGYLFPDTYRVFKHSTPADIINRMLANAQMKMTGELIAGFAQHGLTMHQALTMASIVEREARTPSDKKNVAGILYNRLALGMPLQSDVTVLYALRSASTTVSSQDLQVDSPYNTYKNIGLPPGPIDSPGLDSLNAVANPEASNDYYFLAAPDGTVYYAKTLEEHNALKAKYLHSGQ